MKFSSICTALLALGLPLLTKAQAPKPQPQLSPKAAYDEAMHPLDVTRRFISNWSDAEVQALTVAVAQAREACAARGPKDFSGEALIDLAKLCALGQAWPAVVQVTTLYIKADAPEKPGLIQAYAARLDAALHLKDEASAFADGNTMLATLPYDGLAADVLQEAVEYTQFNFTPDALVLATAREPLLLDCIRAAGSAGVKTVVAKASDANGAEAAATKPAAKPFVTAPTPSVHELYASGLSLAALQQLTGNLAAASASVAALDAALPAQLSPDDAVPIAIARRRYALLGQKLPDIGALASLSMPNKLPELPAHNAITALLLFPDWCSVCVRMGSQFPQSVFTVARHEAYFHGVLVETLPVPPAPAPGAAAPPPRARDVLRETPTVVAPAAVLSQFAATDFPYLVVTDSHGIVRILQPVGDDALQPGSTLDSAIARVGDLWPTTLRPAAPGPEAK